MAGFIINALKIIFLLGFLVLIHEGGHFIVAKLCKVKVNEFAIGFGPTLFSKKKGETRYALRLIPLGGFVSMEGEEERSDEEGSFSNTSIPKKIAIVLAGGMVNIVFGLIVYFVLVASLGNFSTNIVENTLTDYAAQTAGILQGDKIISINQKRVRNNTDINEYLANTQEEEVTVKIERNNRKEDISLKPTSVQTNDIGIYFSKKNNNELEPKIAGIEENSPAQKAGLQENDLIVSINDNLVGKDLYKAIELIQTAKTENIILEIQRNNQIIKYTITPNVVQNYYLGVTFKQADNNFLNNIYYGIIDTGDFIVSIFDNLKQLFTGKVSANQMVGIVGISDIVVNTAGAYEYIYMLALISLSLGLTNLLPFPPLDGGKVVIYLIEAIRRKPMKEKIEINLQMIGFAMIIALSIYVTYNDILRII